ncbi:tyrosine-type recombinase/integrase [Acidocella aminolytica]|uniref:Integrase n=1 Tax=Acidocella aminolytica 101 = DSM 11237 TaxID=1120923 RepID=A0A0D6PMN0_9PROT|nr:tyrosine-type recombinase/integrase [Acidocella aminolytica]GAN82074.1 integrase [Acidocella aminolytica 101 = DSM 11237]GBQ33647.1 integrase [Acidocella aminolytica 101 = DSM 11237]SHF19559.1 Phage integrase family protein [Acidocella aminolytica 101 = DSM 11237]
MSARWPDPDRVIIDRFVASLDLHSTKSRTCYAQVLHGFQDVAERYHVFDQEVLLVWLRESAERRAPSTLLHRTRIVDRFLERLVEIGAIQRNPVVALRDECNTKQCMPIWRALASQDPEQALAELRQPRPFGSVLGEMMAEHVAMMRRRGYKYTSQPLLLLRFDRFLQLHPGPEAEPLSAMVDRWAATNVTRHHAEECEKLQRLFAKILRHRDPSMPARRPDPRPRKEAAKQWRKPHIYSPADVRRMLDVARLYPSPRAPLRPQSMYTMLLLAYCAGLRRGELARLNLGDVDLQVGTITIRQTKFFKTRILPLPDSVLVELRAYINARQRAGASQDARSGLFWHERGDGHYTPEMITWLLSDVIRRAELKPLQGKAGPRVHDLRHSMVVNRILEWYRTGIDPQDRLPFLATYLGHRDINSTLVYITVTQELLHYANERFRAVGAQCLSLGREAQP